MQGEGVATHRFHEPEELLSAIPGVVFRAVPLLYGRIDVSVTTFPLDDLIFQVGHATPLMGFAAPASDRAIVLLPLENADSLVLNGMIVGPRVFGAYGSGTELLRANPQDSAYATLTVPANAVEALLELPTKSRLFRPASQFLLPTMPQTWGRATRIVRAAAETAATAPETFMIEQTRRALRDALLHATRELVSECDGEEPIRVPRSSGARKRIVAAADEYLRSHIDRQIYTDELCAALGVSPSSLAEAFRAVFLISPHRFLKLRRLSMVRTALRSQEGCAPLVKSVALSHGFWHLGQFAHDYRATFGESPSETLARVRGSVASDGMRAAEF